MTDIKANVGGALRLVGSQGWADQDPDMLAGLLEAARDLATLVLADTTASADLHAAAQAFLDRLSEDTL